MKVGIFIFLDEEKIGVNEIQYARMKIEYLEKGMVVSEDKGVFHKWLYVSTKK